MSTHNIHKLLIRSLQVSSIQLINNQTNQGINNIAKNKENTQETGILLIINLEIGIDG